MAETENYLDPFIVTPAGGGFHARGGQNSHGGYNATRQQSDCAETRQPGLPALRWRGYRGARGARLIDVMI